MTFSQREVNLLKKSLAYIQVDLKKFTKYQEESIDPNIKKAYHQVITAKKDHLNLMTTILNRISKGEN